MFEAGPLCEEYVVMKSDRGILDRCIIHMVGLGYQTLIKSHALLEQLRSSLLQLAQHLRLEAFLYIRPLRIVTQQLH